VSVFIYIAFSICVCVCDGSYFMKKEHNKFIVSGEKWQARYRKDFDDLLQVIWLYSLKKRNFIGKRKRKY